LFGARIATLFDDNTAVVEVAAAYFLIVPITYAGLGMFQVASTCFNALGKPIPATALTFARMFVIYLPIAFLLVGPFEVNGVFMANAIANVVIGVGAYLWLRRTLRLESVAG
jgi:Na+-driven multidrug efflux pump